MEFNVDFDPKSDEASSGNFESASGKNSVDQSMEDEQFREDEESLGHYLDLVEVSNHVINAEEDVIEELRSRKLIEFNK